MSNFLSNIELKHEHGTFHGTLSVTAHVDDTEGLGTLHPETLRALGERVAEKVRACDAVSEVREIQAKAASAEKWLQVLESQLDRAEQDCRRLTEVPAATGGGLEAQLDAQADVFAKTELARAKVEAGRKAVVTFREQADLAPKAATRKASAAGDQARSELIASATTQAKEAYLECVRLFQRHLEPSIKKWLVARQRVRILEGADADPYADEALARLLEALPIGAAATNSGR